MRSLAWFSLFLLPAAGTAQVEEAPVPLHDGMAPAPSPGAGWHPEQARAAEQAFRLGLFEIAASLYEEAIGSREEPIPEDWILGRVDALISTGDFEAAADALPETEADATAREQLRAGLIAFHLGSIPQAREILRDLDEDYLPRRDRPWEFLLRGLIEESERDFSEAEEWYDRAGEALVSDTARPIIDLLVYRARLRSGQASPEMVSELRARVESFRGKVAGVRFARQLAIALANFGQPDEAVALIEEQLRLILPDSEEYDATLFLLGLLLSERSGRGRVALEEVVRRDEDPVLAQAAFFLLAQNARQPEPQQAALRNFLDVFLAEQSAHRMRAQALYVRGQLHRQESAFDLAEQDLVTLLDSFPGSELLEPAIRDLAWISWQRTPPRYRTAADYLARLRQRVREPAEKARLARLMGDAYYLNADFEQAAEAYAASATDARQEDALGPVLYQQILSLIGAERLDEAIHVLDEPALGSFNAADRWRAEWNLAEALRRAGESEAAFERARRLPRNEELVDQEGLRVRFGWLQARLAFETGRLEEAVRLTREVQESLRESRLPEDEVTRLQSYLLLLQGQALFARGQSGEALALYQSLREQYPEGPTAAFSLLVEARWKGLEGSPREAEQRLIALADTYETSGYAPLALFEAAEFAASLAQEEARRRAIRHLERLATTYPANDLFFAARRRQAELARETGDFGAALLLYDNLLAQSPPPGERFRAELGRADTLLAQAYGNEAFLNDAIAAFERLSDLADVPVDLRTEAGAKLATAVAMQGDELRSAEVAWTVVHRFLGNPELAARLGATGRYWLARVILDLARTLEATEGPQRARALYELLVTQDLPGQAIARAWLAGSPEPTEG